MGAAICLVAFAVVRDFWCPLNRVQDSSGCAAAAGLEMPHGFLKLTMANHTAYQQLGTPQNGTFCGRYAAGMT